MEASHSGVSVPKGMGYETAKAIANTCPDALFCSFMVTDEGKKIPFNKNGQGVAADTPKHLLYTAEELLNGAQIRPSHYWGVVMQHPTTDVFGKDYLTVLDVDMKRSDSPPDIRIGRLAKWCNENNHLTERSHSKKGRHVIFLAKPDTTLPKKVKLENRQEIEIFGHDSSAGKSVMLTDDMLTRDQLNPNTVNVRQVLEEIGVDLSEPTEQTKQAPIEFRPINTLSDDMAKTEDALSYIDPDLDYNDWIAIGQALHDAYGNAGLSIWHAWSQSGTKYQGDKDIETHWKSFHQGKGVGLGSLFHMAKEAGWAPPSKASIERKTAIQDFQQFISTKVDPETGEIHEDALEDIAEDLFWKPVELTLEKPKAIQYLIDGFIAHSFAVLAGQPGVGKTTAVVPTTLAAAGFKVGDLTSKHKRHIIYVSEDPEQVERILYAMVHYYGLDKDELLSRFTLIPAKRVTAIELAQLSKNVALHTKDGITPWLIIDTASANMSLKDENDNAGVSEFVSAIKETIYIQQKTSILIVTHTAKALGRSDEDASARGASAWEGDTTLTATLFMDEGQRFLKLRKKRYEPMFSEVMLETHQQTTMVIDEDGDPQDMKFTWSIPLMSDSEERKADKEDRREEEYEQRVQNLTDMAHTSFLQYASGFNHPVIKVGRGGSKNPPEGCTDISLQAWIEGGNVPGLGKNQLRKEVQKRVLRMLGADGTNGYFFIKVPKYPQSTLKVPE